MKKSKSTKITYQPAVYHSPSFLRTWLIGRPLPTADAVHQAIGKRVGLAVFASDALSSTAYATQEILVVLAATASGAFSFVIPTDFFLLMLSLMVLVGYIQYLTGQLGTLQDLPAGSNDAPTQMVTLFLLLHAFSSGTTPLTGVEAISNAITAFKEPRSCNAGQTLIWMATILGLLFLSITFLAGEIEAIPSDAETFIPQLARTILGGRGILYLGVIISTTSILFVDANTAFADFPRLSALQASDKYLPRQLTYRGSRLVYSWAIVTLAMIAALIIFIFQANITALIPLYAIGVFLSFTLSQGSMAHRWLKIGRIKPDEEILEKGSVLRYDPFWRWKMVVNGIGALCTAVVMMTFAITKLKDGAWIVLIFIPLLVSVFFAIHRHYQNLAEDLSLAHYVPPSPLKRQYVILPISGVHRGTLKALNFARSLTSDITAIYVAFDNA